ncbi:hypothetical protein LDENG_00206980 [Lucifuga dentata]|nr:hypothetical protein LDENG_00206980 [Lucifuga dentata]
MVADLDVVLQKHLCWLQNLPRVKPFYAVKCNNTLAVLRMLSALGAGFDCASKAEIQQILSLRGTADQVIYALPTKPPSHIKYAQAHGVQMMTFDNEEELLKISQCHPSAKLVLRIAVDDTKAVIKLNAKFGADLETVGELLKRAAELGLEVIGVSFHVGSGCTDSLACRQAIIDSRQAFDTANLLGFQLSLLDIGGGFPGSEGFEIKFEKISEVINSALDEFFPVGCGVQTIAEPGRYYVTEAFTLALKVISRRIIMEKAAEHNNGEESSSDRLMHYYLNDGVHGSLAFLSEPVFKNISLYPYKTVDSSERRYRSVIWGPTCNSMDKIINNYWLPELHVGDWLLIDNMGAYSCSLATEFNGFEKAHTYSVVTAEAWKTLKPS